MTESFDFKLFRPKGRHSNYIQAIWSASVPLTNSSAVQHWLYSDAGSGILFNLNNDIFLADSALTAGVALLPVKKQAQSITLPPGSQLAGIRFHPAVGYAFLGKYYDQPTMVNDTDEILLPLGGLADQLQKLAGHYARISTLYRYLNQTKHHCDEMPVSLLQALDVIDQKQSPGKVMTEISVSQRQVERQFQRWVGMTPKYYQRVIRVKTAINILKNKPNSDLVELALSNGFTDQSHMTREFKEIARITPKQYSKTIS